MPNKNKSKKLSTELIVDRAVKDVVVQISRELDAIRQQIGRLYVEGDSIQSTTLTAGVENFPPHLTLSVESNLKPLRVEVDITYPPASLASPSSFFSSIANPSNFVLVTWYRDITAISSHKLGLVDGGGDNAPDVYLPLNMLSVRDNPPAGKHIYRLGILVSAGTCTLGPSRLIAYNIG